MPQGDFGRKIICSITSVLLIRLKSTQLLSPICVWNSHLYLCEYISLNQGSQCGNVVHALKIVDIILFLYIAFYYDEGLNVGVSSRFKKGNTQIVFPPATCSFGFSTFFVHGLRRD